MNVYLAALPVVVVVAFVVTVAVLTKPSRWK